MIWFTADSHFHHKRILDFEPKSRPFGNVHLMNEALIKNWNERISHEDLVYHLGDFSFGPKHLAREVFEQLNGFKILILGNHDGSRTRMHDIGFEEIHRQLTFMIDDVPLFELVHQPNWLKLPKSNIALCGHVHSKWERYEDKGITFLNVGVDVWNLKPVCLPDIITRLAKGPNNAIY